MRRKPGLAVMVAALAFTTNAQPQATMPGGHDVFPYAHATAVRDCSEAGLPVLKIFFSGSELTSSGEPAAPFLRLEIPAGADETLPPSTMMLEPPPAAGKTPAGARTGRAALVTPGHGAVWLSGTLGINSMVAGRYLNGHFRVAMPDGKVAESGFVARYRAGQPACSA